MAAQADFSVCYHYPRAAHHNLFPTFTLYRVLVDWNQRLGAGSATNGVNLRNKATNVKHYNSCLEL